VPCQTPPLIPENLKFARFAGTLIAAAATALEMRWRRDSEEADLRRRARLLLRVFTAGTITFVLICSFFVVFYRDIGKRSTVIIPVGFPGLSCCGNKNRQDCIHDYLNLSSKAILECWGDFRVTAVRLGFVASYWWLAGASGAWTGLLLLLWGRSTTDRVGLPEVPHEASRPALEAQPLAAPEWPYDLFLSYASKDKDFVAHLVEDLESRSLRVWWDQPKVGFGDLIGAAIDEGIQASRRFAVIYSPNAASSKWVRDEIEAARSQESKRQKQGVASFIIPILYQECEFPPLLAGKRRIDFTQSYEDGLAELAELLQPSRPPQSKPS